MTAPAVELRCPAGFRRLLAKVTGPLPVNDANLIELACGDCARRRRRDGQRVQRVLHRFNVAGQLVHTEVIDAR